MTALFESPTVAGLAQHVDRLRGVGVAGDELEALLDEVEALSPYDVETRLGEVDDAGDGLSPGSESR